MNCFSEVDRSAQDICKLFMNCFSEVDRSAQDIPSGYLETTKFQP